MYLKKPKQQISFKQVVILNHMSITTIKLPYKSDKSLLQIMKQYSSVVRYAYNRFLEDQHEKEIRLLTKSLNNIELLNSWLIQCAIRDAKALKERFQEKKIIFGGKYNFKAYLEKKITKEQFDIKRLCTLTAQGEKPYNGNRIFHLDIKENNQIRLYAWKSKKKKLVYHLQLPKLRKNIQKQLLELQELNKRNCGYTYTVKLTTTHICISFEAIQKPINQLIESRHIGIDLNPGAIGMSINDSEQIIETNQYNISEIIEEFRHKSEKFASNSKEARYYQNKLNHETIQIAKAIAEKAIHYKCKYVFIEQLNFDQKVANPYNKKFNRLVKNLWKKTIFINNLRKRLDIAGIQLLEVGAAYTSYIGNLQHNYTDAINASIEIARRGYACRIKKNKQYYPKFEVKHLWKEMATSYDDWKTFCAFIKKSKLRYRFSLEDAMQLHKFNVFELNSSKSRVINYSVCNGFIQ